MNRSLPVSRSRLLGAIAVFAALAVTLHLSPLKVPAPYAPFLIYELWEIPIVTAFLLYGPAPALAVAVTNALVLMATFPGALPIGPIYNLFAVASMLLGVYAAYKLKPLNPSHAWASAGFSTGFGALVRVVAMAAINGLLLPLPPPIGFSIPAAALPGILLLTAVFNLTVAVYTIPAGHALHKAVADRTRTRAWVALTRS